MLFSCYIDDLVLQEGNKFVVKRKLEKMKWFCGYIIVPTASLPEKCESESDLDTDVYGGVTYFLKGKKYTVIGIDSNHGNLKPKSAKFIMNELAALEVQI